jgi:hypothetical protein
MATKRNRENQTGTDEYAGFVRRILRSYGKRAAAGELDTNALAHLVELRASVDAQIEATVAALRTEAGGAYSWAQIGEALGMDRGAACRKYGSSDASARKVGGQPGHLR